MRVAKLIEKKSYERVEHILHRHAITFLPMIALLLLLLAAPMAIVLITQQAYPELLISEISRTFTILMLSVFYLSMVLFFFARFIDFYLDLWVITNDRIVDVEQFGLFSRTVSELDLFRIQDVTTDVHSQAQPYSGTPFAASTRRS